MTASPAPHRALLYDDASRFVAEVVPFVRDGLRAGDRVLAAIAPEKLAWVREDLGAGADAVDLLDATALYDRHGPMLSTLMRYVARHGTPGRGRVRVVAEQALARRTADDARAYMRYEAAANVAFGRYAASVLCPYDAGRLPDEILEDVRRTHPDVHERDHVERRTGFMDPRAFVRERVRVRCAPPGAASCTLADPDDIAIARAIARATGEAAGLRPADVADLAVAVSEAAANALIHGAPPRDVHGFVDDGTLVCRIRDGGSGLDDPLAGYLPPDMSRAAGRGLWLAHQCCDIVEVAHTRAGTEVFLLMRLPA